ncbi:MAG: hypothetical protein HQ461_01740, partial [Deltaproteobacteria bacterium]|nr:hypothetical protein [Deltaproteobacteria bacterium]
LVPFEDALPERLPHLRDAQRAIAAGQARTIKSGEVPLLVWVPTPRATPAPPAKADKPRGGFGKTGPSLRPPLNRQASPAGKSLQKPAPSSKAP